MNNKYCEAGTSSSFDKWGYRDYFLWRSDLNLGGVTTGDERLWLYKVAFVQFNKDKIIKYAHKEKIPVFLLAGIALNEAGGKPDYSKRYGVFQFYQLIDIINGGGKVKSNATSMGILAIQLRAVAETLRLDPKKLSTKDQLMIANCLMDDDFNISVVAKHLKDLIVYDNPGLIDTLNITEEQFILAASRYNRGIERKKEDLIKSLYAREGNPIREYSSYGRTIIRRREQIYKIMGGAK